MATDKLSEEQAAVIRAELERDFGGQANAHRAWTPAQHIDAILARRAGVLLDLASEPTASDIAPRP